MARIVTLKILRAVITLLIAVSLVFFFIRLSGDPALALAPPDAPPAVVEEYRTRLGLDQPLLTQYLRYIGGMFQGDFGYSIHTGRSAQSLFFERLPATLLLGLTALAIALGLGVTLGLIAALRHNSIIDRFVMGFSVFAFAMPNFFFGLLVVLSGALFFGVFFGGSGATRSFGQLLAPAATLGLAAMGSFARFTRSSLLETLNKPFMTALAVRGVPPRRRLLRHAIPNAAIPVVTMLGLSLGGIVAGAVVTEQVFSWPGIGRLLIRSVETRDIAVLQFIVLMVALTMTVTNLLVDLVYVILDPRMRGGQNG
ncbi:MAG: ABC transporter permease [Rhodobacteraceae bacterium]|nr:ABC transporter permease [Paracoccaceae bacterium]TVR47903.1 MAG: ABC transporter permease [Paracoccaceae bacterium]